MNNEPGDNQEKPKEENPLEINPNASLAEKRGSEVRQNTGPEADQIEEKLPTENKPEEPKQDTVASPEKIEFATGKNSETFRIGDKVSWVSAGGFATNTGTVSSFEENNGVIFAHIKPDSDPENEIELHPDLLSPVENGVSLSKLTLVAQPSSASPEQMPKTEPKSEPEPEWRKGPEWRAMAEARNRAVTCRAEYENSLNSAVSEEEKARLKAISDEAALAYGQSRKVAEEKIRTSSLLGIDYDNLSPEEKKKVDSGVKLKIMEEIYIGEMKDFRQAQKDYGKEKKEGGILNSAKEAYAKVLSNKAVKAYLGIKWYYRIPATTLLFTVAGYGLGMAAVGTTVASATGFAGARMARGVLTVAGGSVLRGAIHKGGEKLEEKRKELLKDLSEQNLDELETIRTTRAINERYDRIQKWVKGAKVASAFGVAGAGMWAGMGSGKAAESVADADSPSGTPTGRGFFDRIAESARRFGEPNSKESGALVIDNGPKGGGQDLTKVLGLPKDPSYIEEGQSVLPAKSQEGIVVKKLDLEESGTETSDTTEAESSELPVQESVVASAKIAEGIFDNPEELTKIKVEENVNSNWKVIEKGFEQSEKFRNFVQGQKDIVVNYFVNKAMGNPKLYDFTPDERFGIRVEAGQEVDLSKLLSDKDEIEKVLDNAASKTPKQLEAVAEQREKIEAWLKKYPDKPLTKDAVAEILAEKVETPKVVEPSSGAYYDDAETKEEAFSGKAETPMSEPKMGIASESSGILNYNLGGKISELNSKLESSILRDKFSSESEELQKAVAEIRKKAEELNSLDKNSETYKAGVAELEQRTEDVEIEVQKLSKQLLQGNKNIQEMAQDLAQGQEKLTRGSVRSFVAGSEPSKLSLDLPEDLKTESPQTPNADSNEGLRNLRSLRNDTELIQEIEERINKDLDGIYAKKRLFGGIKIHGAKSPEFLEIADKPAGLVMQYVDTPNNTRLDTKTIDLIEQNSKHKKFIKMILGLRDQVGQVKGVDSEDLKPFDNENMQSYYRRLGEIMLKSNKPK